MHSLFLIRNTKEHAISLDLIEHRKLIQVATLGICDSHPHLTNDFSSLKETQKWEDFDVIESRVNRYWLDKRKKIEAEILPKLKHSEFFNNSIAQSPHFLFGLAWKIGDEYYQYIDELNGFFRTQKPRFVFFNPKDNFISKLILSLLEIYRIKHETLSLCNQSRLSYD